MTPNFRLFLLALALLLGLSATQCQAADYATVEEAAQHALLDAEALTTEYEAGGAIYKCYGRFAYLPPHTDKRKKALSIPLGDTAECQLAALYHTHPKGYSRLSLLDVKTACYWQTIAFMKPVGGEIVQLDCRNVAPAAQKILLERYK